MQSLQLQRVAVGAVNSGQSTLVSANLQGRPRLLSASGSNITILDECADLLQSLPFELAFPIHSALKPEIQAVAFDSSSGRIAAVSAGRIAVWDMMTGSSWRVHSNFSVQHTSTELSFASGHIVVAGDSLSLWTLNESHALPRWSRIAVDKESAPVFTARLSPSASMLASVKTGSSLVRISNVIQKGNESCELKFRSHASHSVRIRSIDWRPSDASSDSGPVLFTVTLDGLFRIWGCEIDEPDFFSLWATLDVHATLPRHVPLATSFRATRSSDENEEAGQRSSEDDFVTIFSDGSVHLTTVTNFDRRPPTCLSQHSHLLESEAIHHDQLASLRHTQLVSTGQDTASIVGRDSKGTMVQLSISVRAAQISKRQASAATIPVSQLGTVRHLVPTAAGEALLAIGTNGRLQNWEVGEDGLPVETFASDPDVKSATKLATWHDGRMIAMATPRGLKIYSFKQGGRLHLIHHLEDSLPPLARIFITRTSEEALTTVITSVTTDFHVYNWTYDAATRSSVLSSTQSLNEARSPDVPLVKVVAVPPRSNTASDVSSMTMLAVDAAGTLSFWTASIPASAYQWTEEHVVQTQKSGIMLAACSTNHLSAIVCPHDDQFELSIWDSKASEFSSGLQHAQTLKSQPTQLKWSHDGGTLAVSISTRVDLFCAQRIDNLSGQPPWAPYASVSIEGLSQDAISSFCWLSTGLAVASGAHVFFFSTKLENGDNCYRHADDQIAPLPTHHPELLFQALLHGYTEVVTRNLECLAAQLTDAGDVTPIRNSRASDQITVNDFIRAHQARQQPSLADMGNLTTLAELSRREDSSSSTPLTEAQAQRLLLALKSRPLRGLSKLEHEHLAVIVRIVYEIQHQRSALDSNGLRYLVSMHSFLIYTADGSSKLQGSDRVMAARQRLKYRDVVWAFHSESQELLLSESVKACQAQTMTWSDAQALGVFLWLRSNEVLKRQMEAVGRAEYIRPGMDDRDPISASVFYLALRKKHIVVTFWKQAGGHADQRTMLKFLANDFTEARWKSAALKNAFALMSKRRFLFAVAFFLLGDSLKDAVNVCLRQLDDFQLAIAISRVYEGESGPVLKSILEDRVLPLAFEHGYRWLATWAFWMLDRRDLAIQTIMTPLATLASQLPYKLDNVGSPTHEDPCLILLFTQLRSKSLQTMKGAFAVPGQVEFNFVLHMARVLCRMGCHVLALGLVYSYEFSQLEQKPRERSTAMGSRQRLGLRRQSTVMDMEVPSAINSRAPSPTPGQQPAANGFNQMLKKVKVETKAPAEFSFDAFNF